MTGPTGGDKEEGESFLFAASRDELVNIFRAYTRTAAPSSKKKQNTVLLCAVQHN